MPVSATRLLKSFQEYLLNLCFERHPITGLLTYRNLPIPVVDFSNLISGRESDSFLSTRIILFQKDATGGKRAYLGLIAERVTDTIDRDLVEFTDPGIKLIDADFLGGILPDDKGVIHYVIVNKLFETIERSYSGAV